MNALVWSFFWLNCQRGCESTSSNTHDRQYHFAVLSLRCTQPIAAFSSLWNFVRVRSLWLWRCSFFEIPRATPLVTLCVSDRSRCGAVLILSTGAESWQGGLVYVEELAQRSWEETLHRDLVSSCNEIPCRDLAWRSAIDPVYGDLAERSLTEILQRNLLLCRDRRSLTEILPRDLIESSCRDLAKRPLIIETLYTTV